MPETQPVQVTISGREYRLRVSEEQIGKVHQAAGLVNAGIEKYRASGSITMPGDALALCALELAMRLLSQPNSDFLTDARALGLLQALHKELSSYLSYHQLNP
ncbi:MAG: cell division protein ZapA [Flavobacteriales bacterium]|nr:cell division protein ZapA [Flavobacteriales bacterium]MCX7651001.1 cell division protein ZapA [Flavobacteriales bacterium]MDW8432417.1 cell division protein ZapA [Flavobacteriales bacterium]